MTYTTAVQSAETLAALRSLVSADADLATKCEDRYARYFVGLKNRIAASLTPRSLRRWIVDLIAPGSYGFTAARTRHFDEVLLSEVAAGVEQVVLLGAGYDSRPYRFSSDLAGVRVFEIDHPGTQMRKLQILEAIDQKIPANVRMIAIDFNRGDLAETLTESGFDPQRRTLFLWEGVSYYLPQPIVEGVLGLVAGCATGSSILFDYALKSFVDGDTSTYGGKEVARWLEKIGEPFLFGLDPSETERFVAEHRLHAVSDLGPAELEKAYLRTTAGTTLGSPLGHVRIVHAKKIGLH